MHGTDDTKEDWRLPAKTLEGAVTAPLYELLNDPSQVMDLLDLKNHSSTEITKLQMQATSLVDQIADGVNENEITRSLPLAFVTPTIVEEILGGRQAEGLTA